MVHTSRTAWRDSRILPFESTSVTMTITSSPTDDVFDARHAIVGQLRDVHQAVLAGQNLDKGTKGSTRTTCRCRSGRPRLPPSGPRYGGMPSLALSPIRRANDDGAVVVHIDGDAGVLDDARMFLPPGPIRAPIFFHGDLERLQARRRGRQLRTRLRDAAFITSRSAVVLRASALGSQR